MRLYVLLYMYTLYMYTLYVYMCIHVHYTCVLRLHMYIQMYMCT